MTPRDEAALALYQSNKRNPEIEALLDAFFNFPTSNEYEAQLDLLRKEFSECPVITKPFSSSSAPSQSA